MNNQKTQKTKRTLKSGEKFLLGASLLAIISLVVFGFVRNTQPHYEARMATPEVAGKSIVTALISQNDAQVKALSTPQGYASLQKLIKITTFNSQAKLGKRIFTEWGSSAYWEIFNNSTTQESWALSKTVKPGEEKPLFAFKRTPEGWKLDDYVPQPNRLLKRGISAGKMWDLND